MKVELVINVDSKYGSDVTIPAGGGYLFPSIQRENETFSRLSPTQAAQAKINWIRHFHGEKQLQVEASAAFAFMKCITVSSEHVHLSCRAGRSGFWIAWNGDLLACGMFLEPKISLLDHFFGEYWNYIVEETDRLEMDFLFQQKI